MDGMVTRNDRFSVEGDVVRFLKAYNFVPNIDGGYFDLEWSDGSTEREHCPNREEYDRVVRWIEFERSMLTGQTASLAPAGAPTLPRPGTGDRTSST